jgi:hypothetical protein
LPILEVTKFEPNGEDFVGHEKRPPAKRHLGSRKTALFSERTPPLR